jgi:dTDP-4-amino-4,6-dideoxygalactose transaminase
MIKKNINYASHNIDKEDIKAINRTLNSNFLTQGPEINKFEECLKKNFHSKFAVAVSSGTAALKIALKSLKLEKYSGVIVPANTFIATANAVTFSNFNLILAPVNKEHGGLDYQSLVVALKYAKKKKIKVRCLINVFYAGQVWDVEKIYSLCKKNKIKIIEDACHAIGTKYFVKNKMYRVGSCQHCDISTMSFHSIKNITTGEGGCILTNSKDIYNYSKLIRTHGINRDPRSSKKNKKLFKQPWFYEAIEFSENYRLTDIQSSLGISQLKKLDKFKFYKSNLHKYYLKKISDLKDILEPITLNKNSDTHWHLFPVLLKKKYLDKKIYLFNFLKKNRINIQVNYIPIYKHPIYKNKYLFKVHKDSEIFYKKVISLPFHTKITKKDVNFIIDKIHQFSFNI